MIGSRVSETQPLVQEFLRVFNTLRRRRAWNTSVETLRVAALSLATLELEAPHTRLEEIADELKRRAGWIRPLPSAVRYSLAALILRSGADPGWIHDEVRRVRKLFRTQRMAHGGSSEVLAAFLLALRAAPNEVLESSVERTADIFHRWKDDHPFITGTEDYPLAALHASGGGEITELGDRIESIYRELHRSGFGRGSSLQLASQVLAFGPWDTAGAVGRYRALGWSFKDHGLRVTRSIYDELAVLTLSESPPAEIAESVNGHFNTLRTHKPRPWKEVAFAIASGIQLAAEAPGDLRDSQQAAMVVCMSAAAARAASCGA